MSSPSPATNPDRTNPQSTSSEEAFYAAWSDELLKGALAALIESHRRLVTTATTLLGGGIVFLQGGVVGPIPRSVAFACFAVTLALALLGSFPFGRHVRAWSPGQVKHFAEATARWKSIALGVGYASLFAGLVTAAVGAAFRSLDG